MASAMVVAWARRAVIWSVRRPWELITGFSAPPSTATPVSPTPPVPAVPSVAIAALTAGSWACSTRSSGPWAMAQVSNFSCLRSRFGNNRRVKSSRLFARLKKSYERLAVCISADWVDSEDIRLGWGVRPAWYLGLCLALSPGVRKAHHADLPVCLHHLECQYICQGLDKPDGLAAHQHHIDAVVTF